MWWLHGVIQNLVGMAPTPFTPNLIIQNNSQSSDVSIAIIIIGYPSHSIVMVGIDFNYLRKMISIFSEPIPNEHIISITTGSLSPHPTPPPPYYRFSTHLVTHGSHSCSYFALHLFTYLLLKSKWEKRWVLKFNNITQQEPSWFSL